MEASRSTRSLRQQLLRGGAGSLLIKVGHAALELLVVVILARTLSAEGYGIYAYAYALAKLLATPAHVGLPILAVREVAAYQAAGQWRFLAGLVSSFNLATLLVSVGVAVCAGFVAWWLNHRFPGEQLLTFAWALVLVPLMALGAVRGAILQGLRHVVRGQLPEFVLRPGLFLLLLLGYLAVERAGGLSAHRAMALHALGAACAFGVGVWLLIRHMPPEARAVAPGERQYDKRRWTKGALVFAAIYVMHTVNSQADVVILGLFMSSADVGVYKVAAQTAALVAFTLTAVNITIGPQISRLYATGDLPRLQSIVTWSARGILFLTVPVALALVVGGKFVLGKAFGLEFVEGHAVLVVLALAQVFNAFMGPVGQLQNMTGHERDTVWAIGAAAALNVALNVLLIPHFGMLGAALAAASSITAWNLILWYSARQRMGIDSMAIRLFAPKVPGS